MSSSWPCGHPREGNTRRIGKGRTTCARCRRLYDARSRAFKLGRPVPELEPRIPACALRLPADTLESIRADLLAFGEAFVRIRQTPKGISHELVDPLDVRPQED